MSSWCDLRPRLVVDLAHRFEHARAGAPRRAHRAGKNDLAQAATLEPDFDFAVTEQCFQ